MSVKLRLTRMGNKKRSFFRIVATNTASRRDHSSKTCRRLQFSETFGTNHDFLCDVMCYDNLH